MTSIAFLKKINPLPEFLTSDKTNTGKLVKLPAVLTAGKSLVTLDILLKLDSNSSI